MGRNDGMSRVLVVSADGDFYPPDIYGPFETVPEAQWFARRYRADHKVPGHELEAESPGPEPSPEANEAWTGEGWDFWIVELRSPVTT